MSTYECEKRGGGSVVERLPHMLEIEARFSDATDLKSDSSSAKEFHGSFEVPVEYETKSNVSF